MYVRGGRSSQQPHRTAVSAEAERLQSKYNFSKFLQCVGCCSSMALDLRYARAQVQYAPEMELGYDMLGGMTPGRTPGRSPGMTPSRMSPSSALPKHHGRLSLWPVSLGLHEVSGMKEGSGKAKELQRRGCKQLT